uniref:AlNc14C180G8201 protein n=1 Tax=Albugo laibachii Nc14 TaxID=890382 RepID=F0WP53_9STRA|nr:AlNc14C180G8201 [Albugo laibachii Nc14]|eukprot:CCA23097.1 AlNc14C180G8201 [Albugo laibachii Nc14]
MVHPTWSHLSGGRLHSERNMVTLREAGWPLLCCEKKPSGIFSYSTSSIEWILSSQMTQGSHRGGRHLSDSRLKLMQILQVWSQGRGHDFVDGQQLLSSRHVAQSGCDSTSI